MNHPTRIPTLKKALTALRLGVTDPQLRLGIMREDIFEALIPLFERELRACLIEEQSRYPSQLRSIEDSVAEQDRHSPMTEAIERAVQKSEGERTQCEFQSGKDQP